MEKIFEIFNSDYRIIKIIFFDFTAIIERIKVEVVIESKQYGLKVFQFEDIAGLNVVSEAYVYSEKPSIIIEDVSDYQLQYIRYKISISDDAMSFYCQNISIKE